MAIRTEVLAVSVPGLRVLRCWVDEPYAAVKETYTIARVEAGRSEWASGGTVWRGGPGFLQIKQPGDVHRDLSRDGPITMQLVSLAPHAVERAIGKIRVPPQLAPGDARGAAFQRLHDAVCAGADRLSLEVALAEAISALAAIDHGRGEHTRPVRRAIELLLAQLTQPVTLDELAAHAGLDKFRLCRAFRAQVGMPPYAYLTHLRIMRAKQLLAAGVKPSEIAPQIGLYDQSQLNRHFRRIVGTTPGQYARRT
ncbi:MAG TPA: AraC family transcriptional regulator [Kofleriaceae bacterium]|nr:AraC family transcriptional regulator [Kofleriaceae bacterium]